MNAEETRNRAKEIASQKGREQAGKTATPVAESEEEEEYIGLTSFADMLENYEEGFANTGSGKRFAIEAIHPGDFAYLLQTPILQLMITKGVDLSSPEEIQETVNHLTSEEHLTMMASEASLRTQREIICAGVTSMKFVMRYQRDCVDEEVSVYRLTKGETIEIYNAIMEISVPREVREKALRFRKVDEEESEQGEGDTDISEGEGLQSTAVDVAVSENGES